MPTPLGGQDELFKWNCRQAQRDETGPVRLTSIRLEVCRFKGGLLDNGWDFDQLCPGLAASPALTGMKKTSTSIILVNLSRSCPYADKA